MASTNFINECKNGAYANRLGKIIVDDVEEELTQSNKIANIEIDSGCIADNSIIGTVYVKSLKSQLLDIEDTEYLLDKQITAQIGVKYGDNTEEYVDMGKYTIERPKDEKTAKESQITAYDNIYNKLNSEYVCNIDYDTQNVTVSDLYQDLCDNLELIPKTTTFLNSDIPISNNPFTNKETNKIVLQSIAKVACSFVTIDETNDKIDLSWLSNSTTPDYTFELSDYSTLEGGTIQYGPVNSIILKSSQSDSENVSMQDDESIAEFGEHKLTINEDYILYSSDLRTQAITNIYDRLDGLKYVDSKITTYYGKPFLKIGQKIRIYTTDTDYFDTYVLTHKFTFDGAFQSEISSPALTEQQIATKQNISLGEALRNTEIKVDKQNGVITSLTTTTQEITEGLSNNYYTISETNELIQTSSTGLTNTFTQSGGNNIFRNTGLWFEETRSASYKIYPSSTTYPSSQLFPCGNDSEKGFEYWYGIANLGMNDKAVNGRSIICRSGVFYQEQEVPNGEYTVSFKYKKSSTLVNASVKINEDEYVLTATDYSEFYTGQKDENDEYIVQPLIVNSGHIRVEFISNTDNGLEIYDLMVNKGNTKCVYTQNENETTTDTVNISKGITITSSNLNTIFKANADGIRILTTSEEVVAYFTDKGLSTKEIVVENEAQICGMLVKNVDSQTWLTRM